MKPDKSKLDMGIMSRMLACTAPVLLREMTIVHADEPPAVRRRGSARSKT